jgi:hypothetical protein
MKRMFLLIALIAIVINGNAQTPLKIYGTNGSLCVRGMGVNDPARCTVGGASSAPDPNNPNLIKITYQGGTISITPADFRDSLGVAYGATVVLALNAFQSRNLPKLGVSSSGSGGGGGSSSLPAGASTSALQTTGNGLLTDIKDNTANTNTALQNGVLSKNKITTGLSNNGNSFLQNVGETFVITLPNQNQNGLIVNMQSSIITNNSPNISVIDNISNESLPFEITNNLDGNNEYRIKLSIDVTNAQEVKIICLENQPDKLNFIDAFCIEGIFSVKQNAIGKQDEIINGNDITSTYGNANINNKTFTDKQYLKSLLGAIGAEDGQQNVRGLLNEINNNTASSANNSANPNKGKFLTNLPNLINNQVGELQLDKNGRLIISLGASNYVQNAGNTSTTQLASGASFTGTIVDLNNTPNFIISANSNLAYTVVINQYDDLAGTKLVETTTFTRTANQPLNTSLTVNGSYARVVVTNNGGSATTSFFISSWLGVLPTVPTSLTNNGNFRTSIEEAKRTTAISSTQTITTGGVAQTAVAVNLNRNGITIQNTSNGELRIAIGSPASATNGFSLGKHDPANGLTGGSFNMAMPQPVSTGFISIWGATTGQSFSIIEH